MTTPSEDPAFADLFDDLLQQLLEGRTPDLDRLRRERPDVAHLLDEAHAMACAVAGRREPVTPTLGGYEILRELGRGGMGTVYLARHEALGREVALKVLPASLGLAAGARRRFHEEARALARLQHDHIVRIHRVVEHGDMLAFEMEFVDGLSLRQCIDQLRPHGAAAGLGQLAQALGAATPQLGARNLVEFVVRLGVQIGRALEAAHRAGIIHRDVKPANVLLRRDGRALLADFGLARGLDPLATQTRSFVGTPTYAAPEQLRAGEDAVDARSDVYSLGVTLYEALAGTLPTAGRSTTEMLRHIEEGRLVPLSARQPRVPRDLETILTKAMELQPKDRYASAGELADDLERLLSLQPIHARPVGVARRVAKFARRNARTLVAGSLGALLVAMLMVPLWARVAAAAERGASARRHLVESRRLLLQAGGQRPWGPFALAHGSWPRRVDAEQPVDDVLELALRGYDAAAAGGIDDPQVAAERAMTALLIWLRSSSPGQAMQVQEVLASPGFAAATAPLPPALAAAAPELATGTLTSATLATDIDAMAPTDALVLGMVGFVVGEYGLCERAWTGKAAAGLDHPWIDAGLGMLYLADGRPERAYLRLMRGSRALPDDVELELLLADAALAIGDTELVGRWLERIGNADLGPLWQRQVELLRAELQHARGDVAGARERFRSLRLAMQADPLPGYRLAQSLALGGDLDGAQLELQRLVRGWPDVARFRLDLARTALLRADVATYLRQALWAVQSADQGDRRWSSGGLDDLAAVLRLGGLLALWPAGRQTPPTPALADAFGAQRPVASLLPAALRRAGVERWLAAVAAIDGEWQAARRRGNGYLARLLAAAGALAEHLPGAVAGGSLAWRAALLLAAGGGRGGVADRSEQLLRMVAGALPWSPWAVPPMLLLAPGDRDPAVHFAAAFAPVADVDGDGGPDFLCGCPPLDPNAAAGRALLVRGGGGVLRELRGDRPERLFGFAVAGIGDVDGDGVADWAVGAPSGREDLDVVGAVHVFSGRDAAPLRVIAGARPGFGVSVDGVGDWNGDGCPDLGVGIGSELRNRAAQGRAEIRSGADGSLLQTFVCDRPGVWFGALVRNVGDVDGDGRPDVAVGGNFDGAPGLVRVYRGGSGSVLHTWVDDVAGAGFGESICGLGDVDGDGHADVAVTAPGLIGSGPPGRVWVFGGADGGVLARYDGDRPGDRFGQALCAVPDLDGDGRPELCVSAALGGTADSGFLRLVAGASGAVLCEQANPWPSSAFGTGLFVGRDANGRALAVLANAGTAGRGSVLVLVLPPIARRER